MPKRTRGALLGAWAGIVLLLTTGCSAPGPLTSLLAEPQTEEDRVGAFASPTGVDPESTRFLAEHDGQNYWVGQQADSNLVCLLVFNAEARLLVANACGPLPVGIQWGFSEARLLPDGMNAPDGWTAVTANLAVR